MMVIIGVSSCPKVLRVAYESLKHMLKVKVKDKVKVKVKLKKVKNVLRLLSLMCFVMSLLMNICMT